MKAAHQRYKQHQDAQVREQTPFRTGQLVYLDRPSLLTSAVDKMAIEAYPKLVPRALAPYDVVLKTSHTAVIDLDGIFGP